MSAKIRCFDNLSILPLPPYSPELNPVEQLWQQLKQRYLSNRCFKNYEDIVEACCHACNDILTEPEFITNLCSREWAKLM